MSEPKIVPTVLIDRDLVHVNDWNPNEQSAEIFNMLVEEVQTDGFNGCLEVVKCDRAKYNPSWPRQEEQHYIIIGGEHRYKALLVLDAKQVPCAIFEWTEHEQKLKTVRRNLLSGNLNSKKFTKLVNEMDGVYPRSELPKLFGFESDDEFEKYVLRERDKREISMFDAAIDESKRDRHAVDGLTDIVHTLFATSAATVDQNYLIFTHKGSMVTVVLCDDTLKAELAKFHDYMKSSAEDATAFFTEAVKKELAAKKPA